MAISYSGGSISRREYEEMQWQKMKYAEAVARQQHQTAPPEPEKPKHLNPKLLLTKGMK